MLDHLSFLNVTSSFILIKLTFDLTLRHKQNRFKRIVNIYIENMEKNSETHVTINKPARVLHFSDGIDEEMEEVQAPELTSKPPEPSVDPKTLTWGPWFSHYAWKSGTKVLNAVDYAGESLAGFFGITTPKYQIEINEYERVQEQQKKMEDESAGWVPKNGGGDIPLVLNEPMKVIDKADE